MSKPIYKSIIKNRQPEGACMPYFWAPKNILILTYPDRSERIFVYYLN